LFGLSKIGDITVNNPTRLPFYISDLEESAIQFYTPFIKGFLTKDDIFSDHPFLLTCILGYDFVQKNQHF